MRKQDKIDIYKTLALTTKGEKGRKALIDYLEEMLPEIAINRKKFIESGKQILETEAGKEIDLSDFVKIDNLPNL